MHVRAEGRQVLRELDVRREVARRRRAHVRRVRRVVRRDERRLDVAIDGGKDSLSMAARADGEVVKAPGSVVMSGYVTVPDITKTVTPDLKLPGSGKLFLVEFASAEGQAAARRLRARAGVRPDGRRRAGHGRPRVLQGGVGERRRTSSRERKISAGHDVSDGGFVTAVAGDGVSAPRRRRQRDAAARVRRRRLRRLRPRRDVSRRSSRLSSRVAPDNVDHVAKAYAAAGVTCRAIGDVTDDGMSPSPSQTAARRSSRGAVADFRDAWEQTSFAFSSACNPPRPRSRRSRVG